jgi:hypothetical protein
LVEGASTWAPQCQKVFCWIAGGVFTGIHCHSLTGRADHPLLDP